MNFKNYINEAAGKAKAKITIVDPIEAMAELSRKLFAPTLKTFS